MMCHNHNKTTWEQRKFEDKKEEIEVNSFLGTYKHEIKQCNVAFENCIFFQSSWKSLKKTILISNRQICHFYS